MSDESKYTPGPLVEALKEIAEPIAAMQRRARAEGRKLEGAMANQIANDPHYLRGIAREALSRIQPMDSGEGVGADPALVASPPSPQAVSTKGLDPGEGVYTRPECVFDGCPSPLSCSSADRCLNGSKHEGGNDSAESDFIAIGLTVGGHVYISQDDQLIVGDHAQARALAEEILRRTTTPHTCPDRDVVEALKAILEVAPHLPDIYKWVDLKDAEDLFDAGLRHKSGKKPFDYLKAWLGMLRPFAYATRDDSWGEMEKLLCIVMRNYVRVAATSDRARAALSALPPRQAQEDGE